MTPGRPISLPRLLVLTDRRAASRSLAETVRGLAAVVLREKDLPFAERAALAMQLRPLVGVLIVASADFGTGWSHLSATDPVPDGCAWGRSCHNEAEVAASVEQGAAYVTVSPVRPTASKPDYGPPLGVEGLARLVKVAESVPVYALGGIEPGHVHPFIDAGAYGVAVMGTVMRAPDPAAVAAALASDVHESTRTGGLVHISRQMGVG